MFTMARREQVRAQLLERARDDERIVGAAITGSAASGAADRWSDIDPFFGVAEGYDVAETLNEWSAFVYRRPTSPRPSKTPSSAASTRPNSPAPCTQQRGRS
jgi:hypothetical protein